MHMSEGNIDHIGSVRRHVVYKDKEIENRSFTEYCEKRGYKQPSGYRVIFSNPAAGLKSIAKYDKLQPKLDESAWKLAGDWTEMHFGSKMGKSRVLEPEIVIQDMDKGTSCGYPWSLEYHKKREFLASPAASVLEDYWKNIACPEGVIVPIWTCSQKVEMRTMEKILSNSVRTFTASPVEHSYATNRLCLDFNNRFYASANKTWSFVGTSKFAGGWDGYIRRLSYGSFPSRSRVKAHNAFELDEAEYDSSLFAKAMIGQRDIRWSLLSNEDKTEENWMRLVRVYDSIVHSVIVLESGELIQKHTGNPSGSANTIVDNTMILFRLFAYAYIMLCREQGIQPKYTDFMIHVEAALNGDDNTYTCSDEIVGWFTPDNIGRVWSAIGVTTKTPCRTPRLVQDCGFLSQGSMYDERLKCWLPVPETEKVLCSLMWGSAIDDVRWHLLRAYALRIDSYGNVECRKILSDYIDYIRNNYQKKLFGVCTVSKDVRLAMCEIDAVYKTDTWLDALYSGCESSQGYARLDSIQRHLEYAAVAA